VPEGIGAQGQAIVVFILSCIGFGGGMGMLIAYGSSPKSPVWLLGVGTPFLVLSMVWAISYFFGSVNEDIGGFRTSLIFNRDTNSIDWLDLSGTRPEDLFWYEWISSAWSRLIELEYPSDFSVDRLIEDPGLGYTFLQHFIDYLLLYCFSLVYSVGWSSSLYIRRGKHPIQAAEAERRRDTFINPLGIDRRLVDRTAALNHPEFIATIGFWLPGKAALTQAICDGEQLNNGIRIDTKYLCFDIFGFHTSFHFRTSERKFSFETDISILRKQKRLLLLLSIFSRKRAARYERWGKDLSEVVRTYLNIP
jgi:hypothetical protein